MQPPGPLELLQGVSVSSRFLLQLQSRHCLLPATCTLLTCTGESGFSSNAPRLRAMLEGNDLAVTQMENRSSCVVFILPLRRKLWYLMLARRIFRRGFSNSCLWFQEFQVLKDSKMIFQIFFKEDVALARRLTR